MRQLYLILFLLTSFLLARPVLSATSSSYYNTHPIGWMHLLPTGEMPGWDSKKWFNSEIHHANIWNAEVDFRNRVSNKILTYAADFEQTSTIFEFGYEINKKLAHSFVLAHAHRSGGFLDRFIDDFHIFIGSDRFARPDFPENKSNFNIETDGISQIEKTSASGLSNIKYKIKYWPWQWKKKGICACGFATSFQLKIPTDNYRRGLTSGGIDSSLLFHLGAPLGKSSAMWLTSAFTYTPENKILKDWPRRQWHQMYELSFDFGIDKKWGVLFQVRAESPIMNKNHLSIINSSSDTKEQLAERVASGWNSLVHWRGSQSLGFRYNATNKTKLHFLFIEDWGVGNFDERGDQLYVNNAPDVIFTIQATYSY